MTQRRLPPERRLGVNLANGMVHLPYADHGGSLRVSTRDGIGVLLDGRKFTVCKICWPK